MLMPRCCHDIFRAMMLLIFAADATLAHAMSPYDTRWEAAIFRLLRRC